MRPIRNASFCLLLVTCLSTVACGGLFHNWGRIDINGETTQAFEQYSVDTNHRYYISGSDTYPNAIIGLHRDYRIDPETFWKEVEAENAGGIKKRTRKRKNDRTGGGS